MIGENATFVGKSVDTFTQSGIQSCNLHYVPPHSPSCVGGEDFLASRGVEIVNLDSMECKDLMAQFIQAKPEVWNEDIGEE